MNPSASTHNVSAYSFPERALRRWARENLTRTPCADGGVEAVFRFEGSTCGNVAFHLLYRVALAAESADRRIEALLKTMERCGVSLDDDVATADKFDPNYLSKIVV